VYGDVDVAAYVDMYVDAVVDVNAVGVVLLCMCILVDVYGGMYTWMLGMTVYVDVDGGMLMLIWMAGCGYGL